MLQAGNILLSVHNSQDYRLLVKID